MNDRSNGRILISMLLGAVAFTSGCRDPNTVAGGQGADAKSAQTAAPSDSIAKAPEPGKATPLQASEVVPISTQELSAAQWTRHACSLDEINGSPATVQVQKTGPVAFSGYVLDSAGVVPAEFSLVLKHADKSFKVPASTGIARPDVAVYFKNPALEGAGFNFSVDLSGLKSGTYEVVFLVGEGDTSFFCESGKRVDIL